MNTLAIVLAALATIALLWNKIISFILNRRSDKLSKEVEEQRKVTDESVTKANVARESFADKLRKYRAKRDSK